MKKPEPTAVTQPRRRQRVRFGRPPAGPVPDAETVIVGVGNTPAKKAAPSKPPALTAPPAPPQLPEAA